MSRARGGSLAPGSSLPEGPTRVGSLRHGNVTRGRPNANGLRRVAPFGAGCRRAAVRTVRVGSLRYELRTGPCRDEHSDGCGDRLWILWPHLLFEFQQQPQVRRRENRASARRLSLGLDVEEVTGGWLLDLLGLPAEASFGFVTGGQTATFTALAAARHHVLSKAGWTIEHSRRARGFAVYAAIRALGRSGIAELVDRCCSHAQRFAAGLRELGAEVLNDVELNQVLFRFATDDETNAVLRAVQDDGASWMGGTIWDGRPAIRISISNWQTSDDDVERTLAVYAGQLAAR